MQKLKQKELTEIRACVPDVRWLDVRGGCCLLAGGNSGGRVDGVVPRSPLSEMADEPLRACEELGRRLLGGESLTRAFCVFRYKRE